MMTASLSTAGLPYFKCGLLFLYSGELVGTLSAAQAEMEEEDLTHSSRRG